MPYMEETKDITGYFNDAELPYHEIHPESITGYDRDGEPIISGAIWIGIEKVIGRMTAPQMRWPVVNREEREPIPSIKRAIIHERDGGYCRYCSGHPEYLTVDHIIPRSTFPAHQLHIADRSDNLISACFDCNERKSNYEHSQSKRMGVVVKCWDCLNPRHSDEEYEWNGRPDLNPRPDTDIPVYCGGCGFTHVPDIQGWVL